MVGGIDRLKLAEKIAVKAHWGQVDKAGVPYIEHPRTVASFVESEDEKIVAMLHDVVEDTGVTLEDIRESFGEEIAEAVDHVTHQKGEDYMDYVRRAKENRLSKVVKLADLKHNMMIERLPSVTGADFARLRKYEEAVKILNEE